MLSFPAPPASDASDRPDPSVPVHLGDIAIACETVVREAREQGRTVSQHLAHLAVHGFLHLLGYDHQTDRRPSIWKGSSARSSPRLGISDPYASHDA